MNIYEQKDKNVRATWIALAVFILLFLSIGWFRSLLRMGAVSGIFFCRYCCRTGFGVGSYFYGDKSSFHPGGQELDPNDPREAMAECRGRDVYAAGILCQMYVIPDSDPNAFATVVTRNIRP
jgi:hypothetical protein